MGWNGKDFIDNLATKLGDQSNGFKTKTLAWANEGIKEICSRHEWTFLRVLGKKVLTADAATQDISLGQPAAPSVAISGSGTTLTEDSSYKVLVTYYEGVSGIESVAGIASSSVTITATLEQIDVTSIPVSGDPLVTARRVYLSKDSADYFLYSTISDNTTTTATINADVTVGSIRDVRKPPLQHGIRSLDGNPYIADLRALKYIPLRQIIDQSWGTNNSGTPNYWSQEQEEKLYLYPKPSAASTLEYYYYKIPEEIVYTLTSLFPIPEWLRADLDRYVTWKGYEYRDRHGQESKGDNFEKMLRRSISEKGGQKKVPVHISDVVGDSDGYPILE